MSDEVFMKRNNLDEETYYHLDWLDGLTFNLTVLNELNHINFLLY